MILNKTIALMLSLMFLLYCSKTRQDSISQTVENAESETGNLVMTEYMHKQYKADKGMISVRENRNKPGSRIIELPVVRIFSTSQKPAEPVFLLFGGPGQSNIWKWPPLWMLKNHDLVMVGYRGVDGPVSLQCPEFMEILKMKNLLSPRGLKKIGEIAFAAFQRLKKEGIDVDGYNVVEVIDDMEKVRKALGYEKINLYGISFGTVPAYICGLRYPKSIHRRVMVDVGLPGFHACEANIVGKYLKKLAKLWRKNPQCTSKMPHPLRTIKKILANLPPKWRGIEIDRDRLKLIILRFLYHRRGMVMVFNAFAAAKAGDFGRLARLSSGFDQLTSMVNWGENLSKSASLKNKPETLAEKQVVLGQTVMGSPYEKLWSVLMEKWPIKPVQERYRFLQPSDVETLMISASIDFSTPLEYAKKLLPYLSKGFHVVLAERGHQDVGRLEPDAYQYMVEKFYLEGVVDDSRFNDIPLDFSK